MHVGLLNSFQSRGVTLSLPVVVVSVVSFWGEHKMSPLLTSSPNEAF